MTTASTPEQSLLFKDKQILDDFSRDGLVSLTDPINRARKTVIAKQLADFCPSQANSFYQSPVQSSIPTIISSPGNSFVRFEITEIPNLVKIDSVKVEFTIQNTSATDIGYVAPVPGWFNSVDFSTDDSNSNPMWRSLSQGSMLVDHIGQIMLRDRSEAVRILSEEGFKPAQYVTAGEDNIQISEPAANQFILDKSSPLQADPEIAPLTSRKFSLYILGSPLTQTTFMLGMLRGSQKATLNLSFKAGSIWSFVNTGTLVVTDCRLSFEGKQTTPNIYQKIIEMINTPGRSISIPYARNCIQSFSSSSYPIDADQTFSLTQFNGQLLNLFFYMSQSSPSLTSGAGTPTNRAQSFLQGFSSQLLTVDVAGGTSTLVAGTTGALQRLYDVNIQIGGGQVSSTPQLSDDQVQTLAMSATDNKSYLIPIYGKSLMIYPFSTDLYKSLVEQRVFAHGCVPARGNLAITLKPRSTLLNSTFFVSASQASQLVYSAENGLRAME